MRYHWLSVLSVLTAAPLAGIATSPVSDWAPSNWESLGTLLPGTTIDLQVALKPDNENALIDALYNVSTHRNLKYGAHLSKEEVAELVAPHPNTLELVHSWLAHRGVPASSISRTHGGSWLKLSGAPVSQANELLGASYQLYRYAGTNDTTLLEQLGVWDVGEGGIERVPVERRYAPGPAGRGIPDIFAQALKYMIELDSNAFPLTAGVHVVAGIISLLNDFLISERKPSLGFLNSWLYKDGIVGLKDITSGSNPGCDTNGFSAIAGWDLIRPSTRL